MCAVPARSMASAHLLTKNLRMQLPTGVALLLWICICGLRSVQANTGYVAPYAVASWTKAHATFYGGEDASGTMGGACGFGNLYARGYGTATAALSPALFNGGLTCGACFEIKCDFASGGYSTKWCHQNPGSVIITGTNLCPANWGRSKDGWCNPPRSHFDLAYPTFSKLADKVAGIIPIQYRRVGCVKKGGMRFLIGGNAWFNLVLVYNVGGAGNVRGLAIKGHTSGEWYTMKHNWGQNWEDHHKLVGQSISFKVTIGTGRSLQLSNITPNNWQHGEMYSCVENFDNDDL